MSFETAVTDLENTNAELVKEVVRVRDAAMGLNRVYPTVTAGRTGTADGQYFAVPQTGETYMNLYRVNGVTAELINTYPSKAGVDAAIAANEASATASATSASESAAAANTTVTDILAARDLVEDINRSATLSSDNLWNRHRLYEPEDGMVEKTFHQIWDVNRATTKTFVGADGLIRTAAANTLPVSYDPETLKPVGRVVEEARTNLLEWSEDFTAASGTAGCTVSVDMGVSPDGAITADALVEDTVNSEHQISRTGFNFTVGNTYTCSLFVKPNGRNFIRFGFTGIGFDSASRNDFDLVNGIVTTVIGGTPRIEKFPNGWFRVSVTNTCTATTTSGGVIIQPGIAAGDIVYLGDGSSGLQLFGRQVEQGSSPSSYIPTTSAQVTRADDDVIRTLSGDEINVSEFTLFVNAVLIDDGKQNQMGLSLDDDTGNNRVELRLNGPLDTARFEIVKDGAIGLSSTLAASGISERKLALSYKNGNVVIAFNGTSQSISSVENLNPVSVLRLGNATYSVGDATAEVIEIRIVPRALTAAELQAITRI